jgi:triacylglycerol esterase/lipase EstA (alpha/beta hydrolase family)
MRKVFVFVNGSFHDTWCWYVLKSELEKTKNIVELVKLPYRKFNNLTIFLMPFSRYVDAIKKIVEKYPWDKVILVGHSLGGIAITHFAEKYPEKIEELIYFSAYIPESNTSFSKTLKNEKRSLSVDNSKVNYILGNITFNKRHAKETFYNNQEDEKIELAKELLIKEPLTPFLTKINLTPRFYNLKKTYIKTMQDNTISPEFQDMMIDNGKINNVITLKDGDHSVFLDSNFYKKNLKIFNS